MTKTINLNNVKVFRISDLIGGVSPKKDTRSIQKDPGSDKKPRRTRNAQKNILTEASSFKMSNKLAVHGNKPKKVKKSQNTTTDILWLHQQKLQHFKELQDSLPKKKRELELVKDPLKKKVLKEEIFKIETREEETRYILLTQKIIDEYTNILHNETDDHLKKDESGSITRYIGKYDNIEKERLTTTYCRMVNNGCMISSKKLVFDNTRCSECSGETEHNGGFVSCTECGLVSDKTVHHFEMSYKDFQDTCYKTPFSYRRINRFQEILSTLQAKENTEIPTYVLNAVQQEIAKESNIDLSMIDTAKIKYYLKRLSLTNFYEHAPYILNKVNGIPPIHLPMEVEEKFREMFQVIQDPYEIVKDKVCPTRLSFLSYNYVLFKFTELLSLDEYKKCFTLLKSIEKLRLQDKIWKGMCEILGWEYIPSPTC
jgi:hypothetical protein